MLDGATRVAVRRDAAAIHCVVAGNHVVGDGERDGVDVDPAAAVLCFVVLDGIADDADDALIVAAYAAAIVGYGVPCQNVGHYGDSTFTGAAHAAAGVVCDLVVRDGGA